MVVEVEHFDNGDDNTSLLDTSMAKHIYGLVSLLDKLFADWHCSAASLLEVVDFANCKEIRLTLTRFSTFFRL